MLSVSSLASSTATLAAVAGSPAVAGHRPLAIALAVAACFCAVAAPARAQPSGAQAIHGAAVLSQSGSKLTVTTHNGVGSQHSAINWQSFSVPAGSTTHFAQPGSASTSINRVVGANPSSIFGTLSSNGRLVLVNPAGIAVGAGAVVDTAGFTASTLRMNDADALAGRLRFGDGAGGSALGVNGQVVARGGDVVLIAPQVEVGAQAVVQSIGGDTLLAAGQKVELTGRGLEGIRFELQAPADKALNLGTLKGESVGLFASQLRHSGMAMAQSATVQGGKVVLRAAGDTLVDGNITAAVADKGGVIDVLGKRVALFGGASLDVSGWSGGGTVRIGGDYQGANAAVPNATHTVVDKGVVIRANAGQMGDGGRVIIWADEATRMGGRIMARAGVQSGDGGFAEVSGKKHLELTGRADLGAPKGRNGTLLLDPDDIEIVGTVTGTPTPTPSPPPAGYFEFEGDGSTPSQILNTTLVGQLDSPSDVLIRTNGGGSISVKADVAWSSSSSLALDASGGIVLGANVHGEDGKLALVTSGAGTITQPAGTVKVSALALFSQSGAVSMPGDNEVGTLAASVASLNFQNNKSLVIGTVAHPLVDADPFDGEADVDPIHGVFADMGVTLKTKAGDISVQNALVGLRTTTGGLTLEATTGSVTQSTGKVNAGPEGTLNVTADGNIQLAASGNTFGYIISAQTGVAPAVVEIASEYPLVIDGFSQASVGGAGSLVKSAQGLLVNGGVVAGQNPLTLAAGLGGNLVLNENVTASASGSVALVVTGGGTITQTDGIIETPELLVDAKSSAVTLLKANKVGNLAAQVASLDFKNSQTVTLNSLTHPGVSGAVNGIIASGEITVENTAGDLYLCSCASLTSGGGGAISLASGGAIEFYGDIRTTAVASPPAPASSISVQGGSLTLTAEGDITANLIDASAYTGTDGIGKNGGNVTIVSKSGNVIVGDIFTNGSQGSTGGAGGNVTITALGETASLIQAGNIGAFGAFGAFGAMATTLSANGGAGGNVIVRGTKDIALASVDASGGWASATGSGSGGMGGLISINSFGGNILVGGGTSANLIANGGSGGIGGNANTVTVEAPLGSISVGSIEAMGGNAADYGKDAGKGGAVVLKAGADTTVSSYGGSYIDTSGGGAYGGKGGTAGNVTLVSGNGSISVGTNFDEGIFAGGGSGGTAGNGGTVLVEAGAAIDLEDLGPSAGNVTIGEIWTVSGNLDYDATAGTAAAGFVTVTGARDLSLANVLAMGGSLGSAPGGRGGDVTLTSRLGGVFFPLGEGIVTVGGDGSAGGAGGDVKIRAETVVAVPEILTNGGDGYSGKGGNAGGLDARTFGMVVIPSIYAVGGGAGAGSGAQGGKGGTIQIEQANGTLDVSNWEIAAVGGMGGGGSDGGRGGDGGSMELIATGGSITFNSATKMAAMGGGGGAASGMAAGNRGGRGGDGGSITIAANGSANLDGLFLASGGSGGSVSAKGDAIGGDGGVGGNIGVTVADSGYLGLYGTLHAAGGFGGAAGSEEVQAFGGGQLPMGAILPVRAGARGATGTVTTNAEGGIFARNGSAVHGSWEVQSDLTVSTGSFATAVGSVKNLKLMRIHGSMDIATSELDFGTLVNVGTLEGYGTLNAHLDNRGLVAPGIDGQAGVLTVQGNFTSSGILRIRMYDFGSYTEYSQLAVNGLTSLGGTLNVVVSSVPSSSGGFLPMSSTVMQPMSFAMLPMTATVPSAPPSGPFNVVAATPGTVSGGFTAINAPPSVQASLQVAGGTVPVVAPASGGGGAASPPPALAGSPAPIAQPVPPPPPAPATPAPATPAAPVPPAPAPAPVSQAPPPPSPSPPAAAPPDNTVERIVEMLRSAAPRSDVQKAVAEQETVVTKFVALLLKEEKKQAEDIERGRLEKGDPIVNETQCKP